jgi:hypothetical protein
VRLRSYDIIKIQLGKNRFNTTSVRREINRLISEFKLYIKLDKIDEMVLAGEISELTASA